MIDSEAKLVELNLGCFPEASVSGAAVLESEISTFLIFNAKDRDYRSIGVAVVEIAHCIATQFGYPNDEALPGHPLSSLGLRSYKSYEVLNSPWLRTIAIQNKKCFPNYDYAKGRRHFIFTFHDSTFECIGEDLKLTISQEVNGEILRGLTKRIGFGS